MLIEHDLDRQAYNVLQASGHSPKQVMGQRVDRASARAAIKPALCNLRAAT
jgi:hypothetical protein